MSVIIRLQGLPWNANAIDIRRFFQGLSIPDGGVHIVGGDKGDAFIAFSTDEDARQAMIKDGGRINSTQIKLLLSSKTEMQNVISAAKESGPPTVQQPLSITNKESGFFDRQSGLPPGIYGQRDIGKNAPELVSFQGDNYRDRPRDYPGMPLGPSGRLADERVAGRGPGEPLTGVPGPAGLAMGPGPYQKQPENRQLGGAIVKPPAQHPGDLAGFQRPGSPSRPQFVAPGLASYDAPGGARGLGQPTRVSDFHRPNEIVPDDRRRFGDFAPDNRFDTSNFPRDDRNYGSGPGGRDFHKPDMPIDRREIGASNMGRHPVKPEILDERTDSNRFAGDRSFNDRGLNKLDDKRPVGRPDIRRDFNDSGEYPPDFMRREEPLPVAREMERSRSGWPGDRGPQRDGFDDSNGRYTANMAPGVDRSMRGQGDGYEPNRPPMRPDVPGSRFGREAGQPDRFPPHVPDLRDVSVTPKFDSNMPRSRDEFQNESSLPDRSWPDSQRAFGARENPAVMFGDVAPGRKFGPGRDEEWDMGDRQLGNRRPERFGDPRDQLTVRCRNFPRSFNYKEVRRFFSGCEIPREGLKLLNDYDGTRAGVAYIMFMSPHGAMNALSMNGRKAEDCKVRIERCNFIEYDEVVDSSIVTPRPRSRSPLHKKRAIIDAPPGIQYFVIKKLPPKIERIDIKKFVGKFRIVADGGPFLELSPVNTLVGNALVALEKIRNPGEVLTALHKSVLNGSSVEVVCIKKQEYDLRTKRSREMDSSKIKDKNEDTRDVKPKGGPKVGKEAADTDFDKRDLCVHIRGVPFTADVSTLEDFFRGLDIAPNGIRLVYNREGRAAGDAYVEFTSVGDVRKAMEKDKQFMGHRYVELRVVSKQVMISEHRSLQKKSGGPPVDEEAPVRNPPGEIDGDRSVSMQNLHHNTQLEDILDFFRGFRPIVDSIKLQYKDGKPTGDGLVAFSTHQEAESAVRSKNRQFLLGRQITLSLWPKS